MKKPKNMCEGCKGPCCRLMVEISTYDLARIQEKLGEKHEAFLGFNDAHAQEYGFFVNGRFLRFVLKRKPNGECIFFDSKGPLHCKIYDVRPAVCTTYPFGEKDGRVYVKKNIGCPRKAGWEVDAEFLKHKENSDWEWDRYFEIIDEWNSKATGEDTPTDFAMFAFSRMEANSNPIWRFYYNVRKLVQRVLNRK